jgi:RNase H-fold protein (predicted Holliday junction resolvase)
VRVLAVDPGREKCGVAVCGPDGSIVRRVIGLEALRDLAAQWIQSYGIDGVVVGDGTGSKHVFDILRGLGAPVALVAERGSTLAARRRYFRDHPPRGWRRLLPVSLLVPPQPYDDYAAEILAEEYLGRFEGASGEAQGRP